MTLWATLLIGAASPIAVGAADSNGLPFAAEGEVERLCGEAAATAAESGSLRRGRRRALLALARAGGGEDADRRCAAAWREASDARWSGMNIEDATRLIVEAHRPPEGWRLRDDDSAAAVGDVENCWPDDPSPREAWHECCADYPNRRKGESSELTDRRCRGRAGEAACCAFGAGSPSYLAIPALLEVEVSALLPDGRLLSLGQEGFLRRYAAPTVLWPAGYLLAQFLADPSCPFGGDFLSSPRAGGGRVLELGAGIGAASVAVAGNGGVSEVLATDVDPGSLRLVAENSAVNGVSAKVRPLKFDWHSDEDVASLRAKAPFDAIVGASLKIEEWEDRLWALLRQLAGPDTVVVLVHTVGSVDAERAEKSGFKLIERVSGDVYGMQTFAGESSDFEAVILGQTGGDPFAKSIEKTYSNCEAG